MGQFIDKPLKTLYDKAIHQKIEDEEEYRRPLAQERKRVV